MLKAMNSVNFKLNEFVKLYLQRNSNVNRNKVEKYYAENLFKDLKKSMRDDLEAKVYVKNKEFFYMGVSLALDNLRFKYSVKDGKANVVSQYLYKNKLYDEENFGVYFK